MRTYLLYGEYRGESFSHYSIEALSLTEARKKLRKILEKDGKCRVVFYSRYGVFRI